MVPDIPLEKQLENSEALEKVYSVIQMRKEELQKLDDLIKARFVITYSIQLPHTYVNKLSLCLHLLISL